MILICDSGSTKADWAVCLKGGNITETIETRGLNPLFQTVDEMLGILKSEDRFMVLRNNIGEVHFYGVSCSAEERKNRIRETLSTYFPNAKVSVEHDLLGAVRAVYDGKPCSVNILGTGSNSCMFNGKEVVDEIGGLGYILGDEAGGAYFGKMILSAYLNRELSGELQNCLANEMSLSREIIIENVYRQPHANVYLASFAKLLARFRNELQVQRIVQFGFEEFITKHLIKYESPSDLPAHFVGSVAYHHRDILINALNIHGIRPGKIVARPLEGLAAFHSV